MSHNIYIQNEMFWYQTPTHITAYILNSKGNSNLEKDLASLEKLKQWTLENFGPDKLTGKDTRNSFLIKCREQELQSIEDKFAEIKKLIVNNKTLNRIINGF